MSNNEDQAASGQEPLCDCLQCRLGLAYIKERPKSPTEDERRLLLGFLVATLAMEIARHPAPVDELLLHAQLELVSQAMMFKASDGGAGKTKH